MKAVVQINVPNLRGFKEGKLQEGQESYFRILPGLDLVSVMEQHGFSKEECAEYETKILKGNPLWVSLENQEDSSKAEKVKREKESESKKREGLLRLNKKEQTELLVSLGVDKNKVPLSEPDRVELLLKLEKRR